MFPDCQLMIFVIEEKYTKIMTLMKIQKMWKLMILVKAEKYTKIMTLMKIQKIWINWIIICYHNCGWKNEIMSYQILMMKLGIHS